ILRALRDDVIDIIATDHAPHTFDEKNVPYMQAPAGLPLVQHALLSLIEHVRNDRLSIEQVVQKAAHNPAIRYGVQERGFIREGYFADLVLVSPNQVTPVSHDNVLYRCEWTPFDGTTFSSRIQSTWVNGNLVFDSDQVIDTHTASALIFNRPN
ncbi:amidohydrolase family protein, partial [Oleiphilus sp. HI0067]